MLGFIFILISTKYRSCEVTMEEVNLPLESFSTTDWSSSLTLTFFFLISKYVMKGKILRRFRVLHQMKKSRDSTLFHLIMKISSCR